MNARSPIPFNEVGRADAQVLSALLHASVRILGLWSLGMGLAALLLMVFVVSGKAFATVVVAIVLVLGVFERYLAFRLALDQRLFAALGHGGLSDLTALDAALAQVGLREASKSVRPWDERVRGTVAMVKSHAVVVALQTLLLFLSLGLLGVL